MRRYPEPDVPYFITTVTKDRTPLFQNPRLCRILLVTIEYYKTLFDYVVYGYCLMPDHLHLLLIPQGSFTISFIMKMIKGSFAGKVNKLQGTSGPLWQPRFYDEMVRSEQQLLNQLEYMHQNPVKAELVSSAGEHLFSSFHQYHGLPNPEGRILEVERFGFEQQTKVDHV